MMSKGMRMQDTVAPVVQENDPERVQKSARTSATWALVLGSIAVLIPVIFVLVPFIVIFAYGMHKAEGDTESPFVLFPLLGILAGVCGLGVGSFVSFVMSVIGLMLGIRSQRLAAKAAPVRYIIAYVLNGLILVFTFAVVVFFIYTMVMSPGPPAY